MTYLKRHRADGNQREILSALRDIGIVVVDTSNAGHDAPDAFCFCRVRGWVALEIKSLQGQSSLGQTALQRQAQVYVVRSPEEALKIFGVMDGR